MAKDQAKQQDKKYGAPADALASDAYPAITTDPDAKNYVVRPTSEEVSPALGEVPQGRFSEQVAKSEEGAGSAGEESHPEENQPALGVDPQQSSSSTSGKKS